MNFNDGAAVFGRQSVAALQVVAAFEKDPRLATGRQGHLETATFALVVSEGDGIGGRERRSAVENEVGRAIGNSVHGGTSEQKIALRHRQRRGRVADEQFAVCTHRIGFGIDVDGGRGAIVHHVDLRNPRVPETATSGLDRPSASTVGLFSAACETKVTEVFSALPKLPNIGR